MMDMDISETVDSFVWIFVDIMQHQQPLSFLIDSSVSVNFLK